MYDSNNGFEIPMDLADREFSLEDEEDYFFELAPFTFHHAKKMLSSMPQQFKRAQSLPPSNTNLKADSLCFLAAILGILLD